AAAVRLRERQRLGRPAAAAAGGDLRAARHPDLFSRYRSGFLNAAPSRVCGRHAGPSGRGRPSGRRERSGRPEPIGRGAAEMNVADFEHAAYAQRPTSADHYDSSYFRDQWRAEGNDYSLETRRRIEGRNPELIREVFKPRRVLDLGCGPG